MPEILTGTFPEVFLLGNTYKKRNQLSSAQTRHLLLQFSNVAATNRELLCYLYDCASRQTTVNNYAARVRQGRKAFEEFADRVWSPEFQQKIRIASQDPTGEIAKEVWKEVLPFMSLTIRSAIPGVLGDTTSLSRALAMAKRYGPATTFLTITPDDINCPSSFRLACRSINNTKFPAIADHNFFRKLHECSTHMDEGNIKIPLSYSQRLQKSTENPVAVALEYQSLLENILRELIGVPLDFQAGDNSKRVRTWYFKSNASNCPHHKGVFGHITSYFGATETQDRGALHFHVILWGGVTPKLLENSVGLPTVCKHIQKALDSQYVASMPLEEHLKHLLFKSMKQTSLGRSLLPGVAKVYPSQLQVPLPSSSQQIWKQFMWINILRTGIHDHTFSCALPPSGVHHCRYGVQFHLSSSTQAKELVIPDPDSQYSDDIKPKDIIPDVSTTPITPLDSRYIRDYTEEPIPLHDERLIVWEIKRPALPPIPSLPVQYLQSYNDLINRQKQQGDQLSSNKQHTRRPPTTAFYSV